MKNKFESDDEVQDVYETKFAEYFELVHGKLIKNFPSLNESDDSEEEFADAVERLRVHFIFPILTSTKRNFCWP